MEKVVDLRGVATPALYKTSNIKWVDSKLDNVLWLI